ncbi:MAG TPA: oxidoreductase [Thermomicrobiales bacterium]|nr:oxidoreductase [Thermomicrobiales bacterium]
MTHWTGQDIPDLAGKIFVVTGANSGLGCESTLALAQHGATVVMACRDPERARAARDAIKTAVPAAKLELIALDLADLQSIRGFAETFGRQYDRLDVLLNNAGVMGCARGTTRDGFEAQFGVNHLGHFALTGLLLDVLLHTPASRVVTVSSRMHTSGSIAWDDPMGERRYGPWRAYKQSKLANLLFTFELDRRLTARGATTRTLAAHPGLAATPGPANNQTGLMKHLAAAVYLLMAQRAAMGALPLLYAATDARAQGGGYYGPERDTRGYPVATRASDAARDEVDAGRLWALSEELTGVRYDALEPRAAPDRQRAG